MPISRKQRNRTKARKRAQQRAIERIERNMRAMGRFTRRVHTPRGEMIFSYPYHGRAGSVFIVPTVDVAPPYEGPNFSIVRPNARGR